MSPSAPAMTQPAVSATSISTFDLFSTAYQDAIQDMRNADADIDEAVAFWEREQSATAVGILTATLHGVERAVKAFPEFEDAARPVLKRIETVTHAIIASALAAQS